MWNLSRFEIHCWCIALTWSVISKCSNALLAICRCSLDHPFNNFLCCRLWKEIWKESLVTDVFGSFRWFDSWASRNPSSAAIPRRLRQALRFDKRVSFGLTKILVELHKNNFSTFTMLVDFLIPRCHLEGGSFDPYCTINLLAFKVAFTIPAIQSFSSQLALLTSKSFSSRVQLSPFLCAIAGHSMQYVYYVICSSSVFRQISLHYSKPFWCFT